MSHEALVPAAIIMGMWGAVVGLTMIHDRAREKYITGVPRYVNKDSWLSQMEKRDQAIWLANRKQRLEAAKNKTNVENKEWE